jgi:hypothetical protein
MARFFRRLFEPEGNPAIGKTDAGRHHKPCQYIRGKDLLLVRSARIRSSVLRLHPGAFNRATQSFKKRSSVCTRLAAGNKALKWSIVIRFARRFFKL